MSFELTVSLSVLLQRTLVIPADRYSRITDTFGQLGGTTHRRFPPDPRDVFDLDKLRRVVNIVIGHGWPPVPELVDAKPHYLEFNPQEEVICFPRFPEPSSSRFQELHAFLAGREGAIELNEELRNLKWLHLERALGHFYTSFFLDRRKDVQLKKLFRNHLSLHPAMCEAATPLVSKLGSYSAIHVRRGDFSRQYPRAVIPADRILKNISSKIKFGSRLYVATNEKERSFFKPLANKYDLRFFSDIREDRDYLPYIVAGAEMLICASATVFIGNRLSTFSGYITRLRGYRKAADTSIYFTDGFHQDMSVPGQSSHLPYTWQQSIAAGTPLWGREYRESWEI